MTTLVRDRFPLTPCTRCGGSGTYSYCQTWGTTCFQCGVKPGLPGTGLMFATKKVAAIYAEWAEAKRTSTTVLGQRLEPGEVVAVAPDSLQPCSGFFGAKRVWATVAEVEQIPGTPERWSSHTTIDAVAVYTGYVKVTIERDGRTERHELSANLILDRKGRVDPAPYAERAWASLTPRQREGVVNPEAELAAA